MERNKFLTEMIGVCFWVGHDAKKCGCEGTARRVAPIDFSDWRGFGKLWEWSQKQEWWMQFLLSPSDISHEVNDWLGIVHPDRFADAVYEFLKGR